MNKSQTLTAEKIRNQYVQGEFTKVDELKALDKKVKLPAQILAYTIGSVGTLVLGIGMCGALEVITLSMPLSVLIGAVGIAVVSINYFIYKAVLKVRRKKYSQQILQLSDSILNN